jgi:hypothetical protein
MEAEIENGGAWPWRKRLYLVVGLGILLVAALGWAGVVRAVGSDWAGSFWWV